LGKLPEFNLLAIMWHVMVVGGLENVFILKLLFLELLDKRMRPVVRENINVFR
jgi:hypothetical protein